MGAIGGLYMHVLVPVLDTSEKGKTTAESDFLCAKKSKKTNSSINIVNSYTSVINWAVVHNLRISRKIFFFIIGMNDMK